MVFDFAQNLCLLLISLLVLRLAQIYTMDRMPTLYNGLSFLLH